MAAESVLAATNKSIAAAIKDGTVDATVSAGPIAALRRVAEQLDHPDFPVIDGRLDNVSLPTYLRYCAELKLTPASREDVKKEGGGGKLATLRSVQGGQPAKRRTRSA